jgi:hypothetical protein
MIEYGQGSGRILLDGRELGIGYSGHNGGMNNGSMEADPNVGPIPRGEWRIVEWIDHDPDLGPCVARLAPVGHDAHGRTGFDMHGDNARLNRSGSHGCIVANIMIRQDLRNSGETSLQVVA